MDYRTVTMPERKTIALVAHDHKKGELLEWVLYNKHALQKHTLYATGTTGLLLEHEANVEITKLQSGPLGGDQQLGARISQQKIDLLIFFWDPLEPMPHDPDVKALLRIAATWNIPVACNRASADFLFSSPLMEDVYLRRLPDVEEHRERSLPVALKT